MDAIVESLQPRYKRWCTALAAVLILWAAAWVIAAVLHAVKPEIALICGLTGGMVVMAFLILCSIQLADARMTDMLTKRGFAMIAPMKTFWKGAIIHLPPEIDSIFRAAAEVGSRGRAYRAAVRTDERGETWFIRHIIQHGKTATIRNILLIPAPAHWPFVRIHRKGIVDTVKKLMGVPTIPLENAEFNAAVSVTSADAEFATLLLGPRLQDVALGLKQADEIVIGGGGVCVISMSILAEKHWSKVLETVEQAYAAIPPELTEWTPAPRS